MRLRRLGQTPSLVTALSAQPLRQGPEGGSALLVPALGDAGQPAVLERTGLIPPEALLASLGALSDKLAALHDPRLVQPLWLGTDEDSGTLVLAREHTDARLGVGERHAGDLSRRVARAGIELHNSLSALRELGLPHGDVRPALVRVGPFALRRALARTLALEPVRSERATLATPAVYARLLGAGAGEAARLLVPAESDDAWPSPFDPEVLVTPTAWGTPGYAPLGRFAPGATITAGGELYSLALTLLELLVEALPWELPRAVSPAARVRHAEEAIARTARSPERFARLSSLFLTLDGAMSGETQGRWIELFEHFLGPRALEPDALASEDLLSRLESLASAPSRGTVPIPLGSEVTLELDPLPGEIFGDFDAGVVYEARVLLDALAEQSDAGGTTLRFSWERMLGSGAMGSVHRVAVLREGDEPLPCALKLALDASSTNRDAVIREARVLRARSVSGIARFVALVELPGGVPALVTEFAPGRSLEQLAVDAGGRLPPAQVRVLGARLFETLAALHAAGGGSETQVVHGDIKPDNILVPSGHDGTPRFEQAVLIDFGVSLLRRRLAAADALSTGEGDTAAVIGGTPGFMPLGHVRHGATSKSDVFATAVSMYRALVGTLPWDFEGASRLDGAQLAVQLELRMRDGLTPAPVGLRALPPWRRNAAWNRFFRDVMGGGVPARIPDAAQALVQLRAIGGELGVPLVASAGVLVVLGAVLGWSQWVHCPVPQVRCAGRVQASAGGVCAVLDSEDNCGACGVTCSTARGERCVSGPGGQRCAVVCQAGQLLCGTACVNPLSERANCGACGHRCGAGQVCAQGRCALTCAPGLAQCGPRTAPFCAALATDNNHCGACGVTCAAGTVCREGVCELECAGGLRQCGARCVDVRTDRAHCGACGVECGAGTLCSEGHCATNCGRGLSDCGGVCRDLQSDRAHCGRCGNSCAAGTVCAEGQCQTSCAAGQTDCGGACHDLQSDERHCGGCATACGAGQLCSRGACVLDCPAGQSACGGQCVDAQRDDAHCGACGTACGAGMRCTAGHCALSCVEGEAACGGQCVDTQRDEAHCGGCESACAAGTRCTAGQCALVCGGATRACGRECVDTATDEAHCGSCEQRCEAGWVCRAGVCTAPEVRYVERRAGVREAGAGAESGEDAGGSEEH